VVEARMMTELPSDVEDVSDAMRMTDSGKSRTRGLSSISSSEEEEADPNMYISVFTWRIYCWSIVAVERLAWSPASSHIEDSASSPWEDATTPSSLGVLGKGDGLYHDETEPEEDAGLEHCPLPASSGASFFAGIHLLIRRVTGGGITSFDDDDQRDECGNNPG
jgi:hypothetical protein